MSTPPLDSPVAPFEVTCQIGRFVMDSDDPDRAPDLVPIGGMVTIEPDLNRPVRVSDATGMRVVGAGPLEFEIDPGTGKLVHPDGGEGVELINPDDEHLDPRGWTYTARVQPAEGRPWIVTFGAPADGSVVDLGSVAPVAPSPGITANYAQQTVEARDQAESFAVRAETAATEAEDYAPTFVWDGTALVIDGGDPVDLKGDQGTTAWADLTGKPATYPSTVAEVAGLVARLAALEYWSGERDITALVEGRTSGRLLIERTGHTVQMTLDDLVLEDQGESYYPFARLLPSGWRPAPAAGYRYLPLSPTAAHYSAGPIRVSTYGDLGIYDAGGGRILRGTVTWTTPGPVPTTPLGDPA